MALSYWSAWVSQPSWRGKKWIPFKMWIRGQCGGGKAKEARQPRRKEEDPWPDFHVRKPGKLIGPQGRGPWKLLAKKKNM